MAILVTQVTAELTRAGVPAIRVTQTTAELVTAYSVSVLVTQATAELVYHPSPFVPAWASRSTVQVGWSFPL